MLGEKVGSYYNNYHYIWKYSRSFRSAGLVLKKLGFIWKKIISKRVIIDSVRLYSAQLGSLTRRGIVRPGFRPVSRTELKSTEPNNTFNYSTISIKIYSNSTRFKTNFYLNMERTIVCLVGINQNVGLFFLFPVCTCLRRSTELSRMM